MLPAMRPRTLEGAVPGQVPKDYLRTLGRENGSDVKNAHRLAARCTVTAFALTGASVGLVAATPQYVSGAPAQLTLNETWNAGTGTILNDAPCGVADTYWGVAATKPTDAPVKANAVTVQRAASLCAFFTSLPFSRPSVRR
jgi:hypothetical protein